MISTLFHSRRRILKALGMAAGAGLLTPLAFGLSRGSTALQPPGRVVDRRYFGMHMHGIAVRRPWVPYGDCLTAWPEADFGSWRLWDAYVAWPNLQPHRDRWDFSVLDHYVDLAGKHDVEIVLPLGLTPAWASARPDEKSSYKPGNAAEPASLDDWRTYVRKVAERYKGHIRHYEFWNEPNVPPGVQGAFFSGTVEKAVELAQEAYRVLKDVDPENKFAAPATVGSGKHLDWLDRFLGLGGKDALDVLSHHFYVAESSPESMLPLIGKVRGTMNRHGLGHVPIWNTEAGWWIANQGGMKNRDGLVSGWKKLDASDGAAYVARALILGWAAGLERYYWYSWDHGNMGLIEPSDRTLKPAGKAYDTVVGWLEGAVMSSCSESDGLWICDLSHPDGSRAMIAWRESGEQSPWRLPSGHVFRETVQLDGSVSGLAPSAHIQLGQQPVLVR